MFCNEIDDDHQGFRWVPNIDVVVTNEFFLQFPEPANWAWSRVAVARTAQGHPRVILINLDSGSYEIIECMSRDPLWHRWLSYRMSAQLAQPQGQWPAPNLISTGIFPRVGERVWDLEIARMNMIVYPYLGSVIVGLPLTLRKPFSTTLQERYSRPRS